MICFKSLFFYEARLGRPYFESPFQLFQNMSIRLLSKQLDKFSTINGSNSSKTGIMSSSATDTISTTAKNSAKNSASHSLKWKKFSFKNKIKKDRNERESKNKRIGHGKKSISQPKTSTTSQSNNISDKIHFLKSLDQLLS